MGATDYLSVIDDVCKLYHPSLQFPISLDNTLNDKNINNLLQIGSTLDYELSTSHLSRHDILLIISGGLNGKELINYLYKELVFTDINENNNTEYYYVCPYRSSLDYNKNNLQFITKNLNNSERDKISDRIKTLKLVTEESSMNMISTFLVQISNTSSLSGTNALIDSIIQNKANRIFIILNSTVIENNEIQYYEEIIKTIIESGYIRKLNLFVNFKYGRDQLDQEQLSETKIKLLNEFNDRLYNLFKNKECFDIIKGLKYSCICIPSDVRLIEHLLGVRENKLVPFSKFLANLNGSVEHVFNEEAATPVSVNLTSNTIEDEGMAQMNDILNNVNSLKINYSINKLENDLKSLTNINNRHSECNIDINTLDCYKYFQNYTIVLLVIASLILHTITSAFFNTLLLRLKVNNFTVPEALRNLTKRFEVKVWVLFYALLIAFYFLFNFVSNKFLLKRAFDKSKYFQQKRYAKHLSDLKHRLGDIRKNVA